MPPFQTLETAVLWNQSFGRVKTRGYCGEWLILDEAAPGRLLGGAVKR